jgi:hypothetical protein
VLLLLETKILIYGVDLDFSCLGDPLGFFPMGTTKYTLVLGRAGSHTHSLRAGMYWTLDTILLLPNMATYFQEMIPL